MCICIYTSKEGERREWTGREWNGSFLLLTLCQLSIEGFSLVDLGFVEPPPPVGSQNAPDGDPEYDI